MTKYVFNCCLSHDSSASVHILYIYCSLAGTGVVPQWHTWYHSTHSSSGSYRIRSHLNLHDTGSAACLASMYIISHKRPLALERMPPTNASLTCIYTIFWRMCVIECSCTQTRTHMCICMPAVSTCVHACRAQSCRLLLKIRLIICCCIFSTALIRHLVGLLIPLHVF